MYFSTKNISIKIINTEYVKIEKNLKYCDAIKIKSGKTLERLCIKILDKKTAVGMDIKEV
jgi:hypothetical protein